MKRMIAVLLTVVLSVSLFAGCSSVPEVEESPETTPVLESETPETPETPVSVTLEATGQVYDLFDYLWDMPTDGTDEEFSKYATRNFKFVQSIEPMVSEESFNNLRGAAARLKQKKEGAKEDFIVALGALDLERSVADGVFFLWDADNMPYLDGEEFTEEKLDAGILDGYGFIPLMVKFLLDDPTTAKGNIIVGSGGNRSNSGEAYPSIEVFNELGYNVFVLQRRINPYSSEDTYMDHQRAIRIIRYYAEQEGWGGQDMIAACGWSAGGLALLGTVNSLYGDLNPTKYDSDYVPDEIDAVSSDLDVAMNIYGGPPNDLVIENENWPATFIHVGSEDSTGATENCRRLYDCVKAIAPSEFHVVEGAGHGYGVGQEGAALSTPECAEWPALADAFMQANLGYQNKQSQG